MKRVAAMLVICVLWLAAAAAAVAEACTASVACNHPSQVGGAAVALVGRKLHEVPAGKARVLHNALVPPGKRSDDPGSPLEDPGTGIIVAQAVLADGTRETIIRRTGGGGDQATGDNEEQTTEDSGDRKLLAPAGKARVLHNALVPPGKRSDDPGSPLEDPGTGIIVAQAVLADGTREAIIRRTGDGGEQTTEDSGGRKLLAHAPSHMPVRWQAPQTGAAANPTSTALNAEAAAAATGPQQASSSTTGTGSADAHPTSSSTWFGVAAASKDGTEMVTISRRRSSSSSSKGVQRWGQHVQPENVRQLRVVYMKPPRQTNNQGEGPDGNTPTRGTTPTPGPDTTTGGSKTRRGVGLGNTGSDGAGGDADGGEGRRGSIGRSIGAPGPGRAGAGLGD